MHWTEHNTCIPPEDVAALGDMKRPSRNQPVTRQSTHVQGREGYVERSKPCQGFLGTGSSPSGVGLNTGHCSISYIVLRIDLPLSELNNRLLSRGERQPLRYPLPVPKPSCPHP